MIYMTICLISLVLIFFWDKDQRKNLIFNGTSSLHTALQRRKVRKSRMSLKDSNKYLQVKKSELRIQNPFFFPKRGVKIFNNVQKMGKFCHLPRTKISWKSKISGNAGSKVSQPELISEIMRSFDGESLEILGKSEHIGEFTSKTLLNNAFVTPRYL